MNFYCKQLMLVLSVVSYLHCFALPEKHLAIIIPSYNNVEWCEKTLDSVFSQDYKNFHVTYIDDCSSDGTADAVARYIAKHNLHEKITLIRNKKRQLKVFNIYNAIHQCDDQSIVIQIDGDDWFAHNQVFKDINTAYSEHDIWLTYGQYKNEPKEEAIKWGFSEIGYSEPTAQRVIDERKFRQSKWIYMQQRTFYAWLFKMIRLDEFFFKSDMPEYGGKFLVVSDDPAMMWAMLEMAHDRFMFLPDIAYVRNLYTPLNGFKINKHLHAPVAKDLRNRPSYKRLDAPVINRLSAVENARANVVIFSDGDSQKIINIAKKLVMQKRSCGKIFVMQHALKPCKTELVSHVIQYVTYNDDTFLETLKACTAHKAHYWVFIESNWQFLDTLDISFGIHELERTKALGFYFGSNTQFLCKYTTQQVSDTLVAWLPASGAKVKTFDFFKSFLCNKEDLEAALLSVQGKKLETFKAHFLNNKNGQGDRVYLALR